MKRKKLITVAALAVLALACSESVGGMMQDAGDMLADAGDAIRDAGDVVRDAGDMMQPDAGAQDTPATCDKSDMLGDQTVYWAEFSINAPGQTEVTVCHRGNPDSYAHWKRDYCHRGIAQWYEGTNTGVVYCGSEPAKSITVHN